MKTNSCFSNLTDRIITYFSMLGKLWSQCKPIVPVRLTIVAMSPWKRMVAWTFAILYCMGIFVTSSCLSHVKIIWMSPLKSLEWYGALIILLCLSANDLRALFLSTLQNYPIIVCRTQTTMKHALYAIRTVGTFKDTCFIICIFSMILVHIATFLEP